MWSVSSLAGPSLEVRTRISLAGVLLIAAAVMAVPVTAFAGQRLEREEREQLRQELRRQSREDRGQGWHGQEQGRPARRGDDWERRRGWEGQDRPMRYEHYRMSPEEREQLRHMLRERQRGRRD
jgi:uncharacterized membrane protein